jgi:hypothetical protein
MLARPSTVYVYTCRSKRLLRVFFPCFRLKPTVTDESISYFMHFSKDLLSRPPPNLKGGGCQHVASCCFLFVVVLLCSCLCFGAHYALHAQAQLIMCSICLSQSSCSKRPFGYDQAIPFSVFWLRSPLHVRSAAQENIVCFCLLFGWLVICPCL